MNHALTSDETYKRLMEHCGYGQSDEKDTSTSKCSEFEDEIEKESKLLQNLYTHLTFTISMHPSTQKIHAVHQLAQ